MDICSFFGCWLSIGPYLLANLGCSWTFRGLGTFGITYRPRCLWDIGGSVVVVRPFRADVRSMCSFVHANVTLGSTVVLPAKGSTRLQSCVLHVPVDSLLMWQLDTEPDGLTAHVGSSSVDGLHDDGAAAVRLIVRLIDGVGSVDGILVCIGHACSLFVLIVPIRIYDNTSIRPFRHATTMGIGDI